jgi:hypothetical protein
LRIYIDKIGAAEAVEVVVDEDELAAADAAGAAFEVVMGAVGDFTTRALEAGHREEDIGYSIDRFQFKELAGRTFRPPPS